MLQFSPLHSSHRDSRAVEQLMLSAFPEDERRPLRQWFSLQETSSWFSIEVMSQEGEFAGFCGYWKFDQCFYIEHLAIVESHRGKGLGKAFIHHLEAVAGERPMVLEAELPHDATAAKRIDFYEQQGILPLPLPYEQPPYTPHGRSIPMLLLTNQPHRPLSEWEGIVATLHKEVYERHRTAPY